jgi:hypothetical protein
MSNTNHDREFFLTKEKQGKAIFQLGKSFKNR